MDTMRPRTPWLYDGPPETLPMVVPDMPPGHGGYVVFLQLSSLRVNAHATRAPTRAISAWSRDMARYGELTIQHVLVTQPHARYERLKKALVGVLAQGGRELPAFDVIRDSGAFTLRAALARIDGSAHFSPPRAICGVAYERDI